MAWALCAYSGVGMTRRDATVTVTVTVTVTATWRARALGRVQVHTCIGGKSIGDDLRALQQGVHVVSGTPGRVFDMIQRQALRTKNIEMLVIDEADEMLSKGFREQIYAIYRHLPPKTQVILISATLPHDVLEMTTKFMHEPGMYILPATSHVFSPLFLLVIANLHFTLDSLFLFVACLTRGVLDSFLRAQCASW